MSVINGNSPELIVKNGLILNLDAGNRKSYVSGSTNWNDLAGTASAILINGPLYTGSNGGGLVFDGTNDYAIVSSSNFQSGNNPFTMEAWFKLNNTPAWNIIFAYGQDTGGQAKAAILYIDTSLQPVFEFGSSSGKVTGSIIQLNQWYHVVGTYDKSYTRMYLNGTLLNSTSFSSANVSLDNGVNGQNAGIGCFFSGFGNVTSPQRYGSFNGTIPIARHYNRALSASEVLQNYNANKSRFATSSLSISNIPRVPTNGLILSLDAANYRSYTSGSSVIYDLTGNNNSGSLVNGPTYTTASKGGIVFDGIDDHILVDSTSIIPGLTSFTLCLWLNYTIPGSDSMRDIINTRESSSPYKGFLLTTDYRSKNGKIRIQLNGPSSNEYTSLSGANIANGNSNLVCIAVNRASNTATAYVNGNTDATFNITGIGDITSTEKFYIGWDKAYNSSLAYFSGKIYTTSVYNRALSAVEIKDMYNATKARYGL